VKYRPDASQVASTDGGNTSEGSGTAETATGAGGIGNLKGKVVFEGDFSPLAALFAKGTATKDPSVCAAGDSIPNETLLVKDGGLANVFVYLEKAPKGASVPGVDESAAVLFDQKNCVFLPHAMIIRTKTALKVLNDDAAAHNTHTYPKKNSPFNSVVQPNDRVGVPLKYDLAEKEPLTVGCDIHPWMVAYHLPLDHPYAALSAADGTFEIRDLPAGKHEFRVWHEVGKMIQKSWVVNIKAGENETTIKVPASQLGK